MPAGFRERVTQWAEGRPEVISVILFGSRARGDHRPDSDWDVAVLFEGAVPSFSGLPSTLESRPVDWVPIERERAVRQRNVCSVSHAIASVGRCLHGPPLPPPERKEMNLPAAWDRLYEARDAMLIAISGLANYWHTPAESRWGFASRVAVNSALAGELLCKAALFLRGVEPRRSHSVEELCRDLERECPGDPLLGILLRCNGKSGRAHLDTYGDDPRESIAESARRLACTLLAFPAVQHAVRGASAPGDTERWLNRLGPIEGGLEEELDRLQSSECPSSVFRDIENGLHPRRPTSAR